MSRVNLSYYESVNGNLGSIFNVIGKMKSVVKQYVAPQQVKLKTKEVPAVYKPVSPVSSGVSVSVPAGFSQKINALVFQAQKIEPDKRKAGQRVLTQVIKSGLDKQYGVPLDTVVYVISRYING